MRWVTSVVLILALGLAPAAAQAKKKHKSPSYFATVQASGQWHQSWNCDQPTYTSSWALSTSYDKEALDAHGEFGQLGGSASGAIDYTWDKDCLGSAETGNCSIGIDNSLLLPMFFRKAKGGLQILFQLSLAARGCPDPHAFVYPYGNGPQIFTTRTTREPQGLIPSKKIGKKEIVVQLSGNDNASGGTGSFGGQMSGTLTLSRKKQILPLPN